MKEFILTKQLEYGSEDQLWFKPGKRIGLRMSNAKLYDIDSAMRSPFSIVSYNDKGEVDGDHWLNVQHLIDYINRE